MILSMISKQLWKRKRQVSKYEILVLGLDWHWLELDDENMMVDHTPCKQLWLWYDCLYLLYFNVPQTEVLVIGYDQVIGNTAYL